MADLIETLARAMWEFDGHHPAPWDAAVERNLSGVAIFRRLAKTAIAAHLAALQAAGMVVVPVEPTREMWAAGGNAVVGYRNRHHDVVVRDIWTAMLSACGVKEKEESV